MNNSASEFELSKKESKAEVNKYETEEIKLSQPITFRERIIRIWKFITVEPFIAIYAMSNALSYLAIQNFMIERECTVDLNFPGDICYKIVKGIIHDNSTMTINDQVTAALADLASWKQPLERFLPAIFILNIGAWSDRTGNRKALIMIPIIGQVLSMGSFLAGAFLPNMPIWIINLIDSLVLTLTGGASVMLAGVYSYVADATDPAIRTQKMGAISVTMTISGIVGQLLSGHITQSTGHTIPIAISLLFGILGVLYTYFKIHDVNRKKEDGTVFHKLVNFLNPMTLLGSFSLLAFSKGRKFMQILLVLLGYIIFNAPFNGVFSTIYIYLHDRYHMNEVEFTWFDTIVQIIGPIIGTAVGLKLFTDILKLHDCLLGVISTLSRLISYFVYAFAPDRVWLYVGAVSDFFGTIALIVVRSLSTKIVDSGDAGKMSSILALIDALIVLIAMPLITQVWKKYIETFKGASYVLGGILTIPNFFIMFGLYYIDKKLRSDVVADTNAKKKDDNEITSV